MGGKFFYQKQVKRCHWSSLTQKPLFNAVLCVFVGVLLWSCPFFNSAKASESFSDNFENGYSYGHIQGQNGWTACAWTPSGTKWDIVASPTHSGSYGVYLPFLNWWNLCMVDKSTTGDAVPDGTSTIWFYTDGTGDENTASYTATEISIRGFSGGGAYGTLYAFLKKENWILKLSYYDYVTETFFYLSEDLPLDEWWSLTFEWSVPNDLWRIRFNDNAFSEWIDSVSILGGAKGYHIENQNLMLAFDDIGVAPAVCEIGGCQYCEIYDTCVEAGCFWYHADWTLTPNEWCTEPPEEPAPEECGAFYKCQYCDQTGCEAQTGFCDWTDIGFGDKCYMTEPEIPPEQGEWEAPELDECGALSGVELWLCNIKNFIAGIFMPTEAKVNEFYSTIGNFKTRFPFNYSRALATFFGDIKTSFATENEVSVKILGESGNVDFEFWSASTTIGGTAETFANVIKDISTFIIFLVLAVWIISLIRRFL